MRAAPSKKAAPASAARVVPGSQQTVRTQATRRKLLKAAESIFARDGFEATRLEDIAATAGYTRGAFYANFESKEDIFFALLEHWIAGRMAQINSLLSAHKGPSRRLQALREHYAQLAEDRGLALLSLEFKLFAIRHPKAHARLRAHQQKLRVCGGAILGRVMEDLGRTLSLSSTATAAGLSALSNALLLEHLVDPKSLPDQDTRELLGAFFDAVLQDTVAK